MNDFREELYNRYVTKYKSVNYNIDHELFKEQWPWYNKTFLPLLKELDHDAAILELGCGPGYMLKYLENCGYTNVKGIDISKEQIDIAVEQGLKATVENAFDFFKASEKCFNAIIAIDFVEHFTKNELLTLLPLIQKSLSPGGIFIIQTPNGQGLFPHQIIYGDLTHLTIFNTISLRQLLNITGFEDVIFLETANFEFGLVGRLRALAWKVIKIIANLIRKIETGKTQEIWTENLICCCRKISGDEER